MKLCASFSLKRHRCLGRVVSDVLPLTVWSQEVGVKDTPRATDSICVPCLRKCEKGARVRSKPAHPSPHTTLKPIFHQASFGCIGIKQRNRFHIGNISNKFYTDRNITFLKRCLHNH